ncbi:MAG: hypothetical protein D3926_01400 [Desulfobacteraceae bacterium]|mgnify:FL=1|nr:MAG: hypothetical protein D3926_01400 [Desulfobacteraceae bacterium]
MSLLYEEKTTFPAFTHEDAFKQLFMGRGDLVIVNSDTGNAFIKELNLADSGIRMLEPPLVEFDLYPYIHKKHKAIAGKLALTIKEMKEDGTYQRLIHNPAYE